MKPLKSGWRVATDTKIIKFSIFDIKPRLQRILEVPSCELNLATHSITIIAQSTTCPRRRRMRERRRPFISANGKNATLNRRQFLNSYATKTRENRLAKKDKEEMEDKEEQEEEEAEMKMKKN